MKKKIPESFFTKSKARIDELKTKLEMLSKKKRADEIGEKELLKKTKEPIKEVKVIISIESVVKATVAIFLLAGLAYIMWVIKPIIILFLVALFLAATFNPTVDRLEAHKIPRPAGILILFLLVIGVFVVMFSNLIPIIYVQVSELAINVRSIVQNLVNNPNPDSWFMQKLQPYANQLWQNIDQAQLVSQLSGGLKTVASKLGDFAGNALGAILTVFNGIFNLILVLLITFFMVVNKNSTSHFFASLFPHRYEGYITLKRKQISIRIGEWIRGQMLLALAMGILTFVVFSIVGINYALTLAMVAAVAEFIPYLGPIITFASAALIALNQDPVLVLWPIPAYAVIQFLEGNILVPLIVGRSVGLNPIVVIFALLTGAALGKNFGGSFGLALVGMIIAVPIANIISLFVEEYTERNK